MTAVCALPNVSIYQAVSPNDHYKGNNDYISRYISNAANPLLSSLGVHVARDYHGGRMLLKVINYNY